MLSNVEIGLRMRQRRKELGLTLQNIADEIGVQNSTILRYEKGSFEKIKLPVIEAIAEALHVNPEWLIGETDDPIDYEDGELISQIPLSYVEACGGDIKKAYAAFCAVDQDAEQEQSDFADAINELGCYPMEIVKKLKTLADSLDQLNSEGREKLLDYAADLVASGRYIKSYQSELGQKEA